ncbi:hypothetical protein FQA39_LY16386 [Lamprigera yunnana]|nr:hypothetical protein FQA39_LY16386 [Lamprigera yunnana]
MSWLVVKFHPREDGGKESVEAVPTSWVCDDQCYWPPFTNNSDTVKAVKSCWTPDKLKWKSHAITVLSNKECSSFANACKKATKGLSSADVDTTEAEELPSKRRKKSNRRYSSDEERSSSDDNDMLDYPPTTTPKNQQSNSMKQKLSNSLDDRISCKSISPHHQLQSKSHLDETMTADKIELASSTSVENKFNDLIKLVIKNNRLVKHQMVYIELLEKKVDAPIKDRGILNRIECQL